MHSETLFKPVRQNLTINRSGNLGPGLNSLQDGLVGAWLFNETGSRVVNNYANISGYGNATMQTAPTWSGSQWGSALRFVASSSDYAVIPNFSGFRPTTYPFAIAARAMIPTSFVGGQIWTNDDVLNTLAGITLLASSAGGFYVRLGDNAGTGSTHRKDMPLATSVGANVWASVAFNVYSISSFKGYLNGVVDTGSVSGTAASLAYNTKTLPIQGSMGREDVSSSNPEVYSDHFIDYIYFWTGRSISDQAALQIAQDPYCIFENRSRAWLFVTAPASGWPHKFNGVANASISKINGVSKASISKVSGVA